MKLFRKVMWCPIADTLKLVFITGQGVGTFASRGRGRKSVMSDVEAYRKQGGGGGERGSLPFSWNRLGFILPAFSLSKFSVSEERMKQHNWTLISLWKWLLRPFWNNLKNRSPLVQTNRSLTNMYSGYGGTLELSRKFVAGCIRDFNLFLSCFEEKLVSYWLTRFVLVMAGNVFWWCRLCRMVSVQMMLTGFAHVFTCCGFGWSVISLLTTALFEFCCLQCKMFDSDVVCHCFAVTCIIVSCSGCFHVLFL